MSRATLARSAVDHGWSVRTAEERARESNASGDAPRPRLSSRAIHPDQEHAARAIADALGAALGAEVRVKVGAGGRYKAELSFGGPDEALELARRLGLRLSA